MSNPDQGAAHMVANVSMPPSALPNSSPPVVEPESKALGSTRRSEIEWLSNRENIERLTMDENCNLKGTMEAMKDVYGFSASSTKYKGKLKEWRYNKNLTRRQGTFIGKMAAQRCQKQGRKMESRIRGSLVPQTKVERTVVAAVENGSSPACGS
ncbi:hypothetical protein N7G274_007759 [Stereocaulon virgatum]|uniref:Clr5 domain-containing protein n=1 Tax=Stereocaulon virgatum TaxID=373712 RepID=A0ABR4A0M7_9LECA